jgi:hypothetical protein
MQTETPPKAMWEFYQKLAHDDSFRTRLENNPQEVLKEHHIQLPAECGSAEVTLPAKEEIARALQSVTAGREFAIQASETNGWGSWWVWAVFALMPAQHELSISAAGKRLN